MSNYGSTKSVIYVETQRAIGIADGCNGLELFVLFAGFLICFPQPVKKQLAYMVTGVAYVYGK